MYTNRMTLSEELQWRGFVNQTTLPDINELDKNTFNFYWGVDPSAPSMTIGNLAAAMMVKHFLRHGHKGFLLVGGATGLIGDPDGKKDERQLKSLDEVSGYKEGIISQYKSLYHDESFEIVDNYDWFKDIGYLEFLRDVGKHVPMRQMLGRDFIQTRLSEGGSGISYAEFSYVLIQAYDFLHLNKEHGVNLQLCGSDQWGNSIAGVDLIRRTTGEESHVWSTPLVINKTTGVKFGKSEEGAVWLDPNLTSVYRFYQFWLNVDDAGVEDYIKIFTLLPREEIERVLQDFQNNPGDRLAQKTLAYEVTKLVHGQANADSVVRVTNLLFGSQPANEITHEDAEILKTELSTSVVSEDTAVSEALVSSDLVTSKGEARRLLEQGGIKLNGQKLTEDKSLTADDKQVAGSALLQRGKNKFALIDIK